VCVGGEGYKGRGVRVGLQATEYPLLPPPYALVSFHLNGFKVSPYAGPAELSDDRHTCG
jgi:hypothetical protein